MSKIKIKELSEKMSLDVKEILAKCKELSIVARTQSSSISLEDAKKIQISLVGEPILKKPKTDNEIIKRSGSKVTIRRKKRPEPIKKESSKEEEKKVESQDKRDLKPTNDLKNQINNQNIHLSALLVEDKIIAVHMGYLYKKNFFYILPAYDYNYKKLSVGNILLLELFENFKKNLNIFDFTIGEEIYKAKWTNNKNQAYDFIFYTDLKGFIFYIFMLSKKIIKKSNFLTKNIKFIYHFFKK